MHTIIQVYSHSQSIGGLPKILPSSKCTEAGQRVIGLILRLTAKLIAEVDSTEFPSFSFFALHSLILLSASSSSNPSYSLSPLQVLLLGVLHNLRLRVLLLPYCNLLSEPFLSYA